MKRVGWLISRYLITSVTPYFAFSWILLTVILFVRTASSYSDTIFNANIPSNLIWQLTIALLPNVVAFTCPMAILVGTIIGLTKMQSDSELVAIRASGVGNLQIALPILLLGFVMSGFAFLVNLRGVPLAASLVRSVVTQAAIKKLESPLEPGVFNTQVNGYTIYVKGADFETNTWKNIFIYSEDAPNSSLRLITSRNGRIDLSGEQSELVLENATVSTLPLQPGSGKYVTESIGDFRFAIKTRRNELIDKLKATELRPEELGLQELSDYASAKTGDERTEATILWQRRIVLSITPLIFSLLGTVIVLRFNRGGRGFAVATAFGVLVGFYLLAFLGEQLARVGAIGVVASGIIPVVGSLAVIAWLGWSGRVGFVQGWIELIRVQLTLFKRSKPKLQKRNLFVDLTTGLRDFDLLSNLILNYALTLAFLTVIFLIFTGFELWKFAGTFEGGVLLLGSYLVYLLPFIYLQIAPSAAMVGTLATYVIKSRNNEIVTWTSAGQSVYRLLLPCFVLMAALGVGNWSIQEKVLPGTNRLQDSTRELIRNRGVVTEKSGKFWVANEKRIYSFEFASDNDKISVYTQSVGNGDSLASDNMEREAEASFRAMRVASDNEIGPIGINNRILTGPLEGNSSDNGYEVDPSSKVGVNSVNAVAVNPIRSGMSGINGNFGSGSLATVLPATLIVDQKVSASDNDKPNALCLVNCVKNLVVYEFDDTGERLRAVYRGNLAQWSVGQVRFLGTVEKNELVGGKISTQTASALILDEVRNPFAERRIKPNHLSVDEIRTQIELTDADVEKRTLEIGLEKKYTTLFLPLVMALFTAPFALSLSRKGKAATVGYAVLLWLLFTGTNTVFEQAGQSFMLSPVLAVWSPLLIFTFLGVFLLSKVKT
jgi:lipopolysaccharide export LptBFGC system permease protein LptF